MDLEDFIKTTDWKNLLIKKPLIGFEIALVSDLMFAKEKDMKFANYLITETEKAFVVTTIDHEFAGEGIYARQIFSMDLDKITKHIIDLYPADDFNRSEMAGDPRGIAFVEFVKQQKFMKQENIIEFYKKVCEVNLRNVEKILNAIDKNNEVISPEQGMKFEKMIIDVQKGAEKFLIHSEKDKFVQPNDKPAYSLK
jgi:hypothetical protein